MEAEDIRSYCLSKPWVTESFPFNETALVFKVGNKMFLLMDISSHPLKFNAKANPEWSVDLREEFHQITGAYHMNKTHWNTINTEGLKINFIKELIDHSYDLVYNSLPKRVKLELENEKNVS